MTTTAPDRRRLEEIRRDHVPLKNITFSLTLACNQGCSHCWVSAGNRLSGELEPAEIERVLAEAAALGAEHVKFSGGDPLVKRGFIGLVLRAAELGFRISVETNGLALNDILLSQLSPYRDRIHFYVSLDGARAETHDCFRGSPGAFARTSAKLRLLRRAEFYFSVHTVVGRHNLNEVLDLFRYVRELGASQHKLILTIHNLGRGSDSQHDQLTLEEVFKLLEQLPPQQFWDYHWNPDRTRDTTLMTTLPPAFQPRAEALNVKTCGWGTSFIGILANGDVAICHGLYDIEQTRVGNVRSQPLTEIWKSHGLLQRSRGWERTDFEGICGNCAVFDACRGLCRASAIAAYGDLKAPYPLCQTAFESGNFPREMLVDPALNSSYTRKMAPPGAGSNWTSVTLRPAGDGRGSQTA